jgi:hypothetical protein
LLLSPCHYTLAAATTLLFLLATTLWPPLHSCCRYLHSCYNSALLATTLWLPLLHSCCCHYTLVTIPLSWPLPSGCHYTLVTLSLPLHSCRCHYTLVTIPPLPSGCHYTLVLLSPCHYTLAPTTLLQAMTPLLQFRSPGYYPLAATTLLLQFSSPGYYPHCTPVTLSLPPTPLLLSPGYYALVTTLFGWPTPSCCNPTTRARASGRYEIHRSVVELQIMGNSKSSKKTRYGGHINSRLMRFWTHHDQTNGFSYYMRESHRVLEWGTAHTWSLMPKYATC